VQTPYRRKFVSTCHVVCVYNDAEEYTVSSTTLVAVDIWWSQWRSVDINKVGCMGDVQVWWLHPWITCSLCV